MSCSAATRPRPSRATSGTSPRSGWSTPSAAARTPCGWSSSTASGASAPWREAGPDAAEVVYDEYSDASLRNQAVEALAEHGTMALAMLDKYATDPDFRDILRVHGAAVIPPIAQTDAGPETLAYLRSKPKRSFTESLAKSVLFLSGENGQSTIRTIKSDGLERVAALNSSDLKFYQFLPLYDLLHLGNVLRRGYSPTSGEMAWALVDGCFVVADALSLAAIQPEGVVVAEATRAELKAATRGTAHVAGRELIEEAGEAATRAMARRGAAEGAEAATEHLSRWWTVRLAGGTYQVLRRLPEALTRLSVARGRRPRPAPLHQGRAPPEHLGADPPAQERPGNPPPHPPRARPQIPGRPGRPGGRRRRRVPQDGRTSGLQKAAKSTALKSCGFHDSREFLHFARLPPFWCILV